MISDYIGSGTMHRLRFHTSYPDSGGQGEKGGTVHFGKVSWLPKLFCILLSHPCLPNNISTSGLDSSPHPPHLWNIHYPTYILFYLSSSQELLISCCRLILTMVTLVAIWTWESVILPIWVGSKSPCVFPLPLNFWVALSLLFTFLPRTFVFYSTVSFLTYVAGDMTVIY